MVLLLFATFMCKSFFASNSFVAYFSHYMCFFASCANVYCANKFNKLLVLSGFYACKQALGAAPWRFTVQ